MQRKVFGATPGLGGVIGGTTLLTGITEDNPIKNVFTGEPLIGWSRWHYRSDLSGMVIKYN